MKAKRLNKLTKNIFLGILIPIMIFSFTSCAVRSTFLTSSVVPAAEGKVKIKRDKNQNYVIKIYVSNLAEVERLLTSKHNYVVWMETDQGKTENLGQLKSSRGFLSKKLEASLETRSSYNPAKIYITAEDNTDAEYPGTVILSTSNF